MADVVAPKTWKPASLLTVTGKDPNFTYRWVAKDKLEKAIAEGWEVVKGNSSNLKGPDATIVDGSQKDSTIQKRNLILCKMPNAVAAQRNEYYASRSKELIPEVTEQLKRDTVSLGGKIYGETKSNKGV